jgi:hypothetical protein
LFFFEQSMSEFLVIAILVLTLGFFAWFFIRMRRPKKPKAVKDDHRTRQERAVWAWAKIMEADQGPINTFRMARVVLKLEVHMPGTPAYLTKTTWMVEEESLASVEEGKEIPLRVDPVDPKYVYPNGAWAKIVE